MKNLPAGVRLRGSIYWWDSTHERLNGGDRVRKSLEVRQDHPDAATLLRQRVNAISVFMDRGEWPSLERWVSGDLDITDLVRTVTQGDWRQLDSVVRPAPTLSSEVAQFLRVMESKRSSRTVSQYGTILRGLLEFFGPEVRMSDLTVEVAEAWLFGPRTPTGKWSRNTIRQVRALCSQVWDRVIEREERRCRNTPDRPSLTFNPWAEIKPPKKPPSRANPMTKEQYLTLLEALRGTPYALWMSMAFLAGLRQQEAARLVHGDWDLEGGWLNVRGTKTDNAVRSVPIPNLLRTLYDEHVEAGFGSQTFLFTSPTTGKPIGARTAVRWAMEAYRMGGFDPGRSGDDGFTYHSGRHSYATWLAQDNVSPVVGAALIGDTVAVYVSTYVHLVRDDLVFAVDGLDRAIRDTFASQPA